MTQSNICKHCKKGLVPNHYYLFGRYLCMKNSKTIGTSFTPEKEKGVEE